MDGMMMRDAVLVALERLREIRDSGLCLIFRHVFTFSV
jgi:hypothetical protein